MSKHAFCNFPELTFPPQKMCKLEINDLLVISWAKLCCVQVVRYVSLYIKAEVNKVFENKLTQFPLFPLNLSLPA